MAWVADKRNLAWMGLVAVLVTGLYALVGWTAITIDRRLNPRGQPLLIDSISFTAPPVAGQYTWLKLEIQKLRDCTPDAQIIYLNPAGEERAFSLDNWPLKDLGTQTIRMPVQIPELYPGAFRVQVRGLWQCQEEIYPVTSEPVDVKIVAPPEG